jgi:hypothetical protein
VIKKYVMLFPAWPGSATASITQTVTASGSSNTTSAPYEYKIAESFNQAILYLTVSAVSGTSPSLTVAIQEWDPGSNQWVTIDTFAPITATTTSPVRRVLNASGIPPSYPTSGNGSAGDATLGPFGQSLRVSWTVTGTTPSFTWTLGAVFISPPSPSEVV